jgi:HPt (histidine-containing phosphotransfer) domain-containing protein
MAAMFLSEWDGHLERVNQALQSSDAHELRMNTHTLKGLLAMFHAEHARRRAMEMENAALSVESTDWTKCRRLFAELTDEMAKIRPAIIRFVETRELL